LQASFHIYFNILVEAMAISPTQCIFRTLSMAFSPSARPKFEKFAQTW